MKILIIQLRRVGDILLTTPAVSYLKQAFPDASIDFLCEPMGKSVLQSNPDISELLLYDKNRPVAEVFGVRQRRYDVVFDFMNNPRSVLLAAMSGAPEVVGFKHGVRSLLYKMAVPGLTQAEYVAKRKIDVVQYWLHKTGRTVSDVRSYRPSLYLTKEEESFADRWWEENKVGDDFVLIAPANRYRIRTWEPEYFRETGLRLVREDKKKVFIAWGPGEESFVAEVRRGVEAELPILPKTNVREMAALIKRSRLLLAPSSGAMHVAVAVGTPTVTMYGAVRAIDWEPLTTPADGKKWNFAVTADNIPCLGCHLNDGCPFEHRCMTELSVDRVLGACRTILKEDTKHVR